VELARGEQRVDDAGAARRRPRILQRPVLPPIATRRSDARRVVVESLRRASSRIV
jgi:hypothetical protein